jgi:hypothetical protein
MWIGSQTDVVSVYSASESGTRPLEKSEQKTVLIVTETCKPVEPSCRETSQEFRSSTRHIGSADNIFVHPDESSPYQLFQPDRPFGRVATW